MRRNHQPLGLRYRSLALLVPLRVVGSSYFQRVRRVVAPAGESLWCSHNFAARSERTPAARTFVAPNESNQSKGALHSSQRCGCRVRPMRSHATARGRTHAAIGNRAPMRSEARQEAREAGDPSLGPLGEPSSSAGLCGSARNAHQPLTSGSCPSAAAAGRVASSARPAKTEQRRAVGPRPTGEQGAFSFGSFSLGKQRKGTALSGAHPDAVDQARQKPPREARANQARLRYLSPSGWRSAPRGQNRGSTAT
jgi:hypothetical protein